MGLEDEAATRDTQTPGWRGTKEECCSEGAEAGVMAETGNYHLTFQNFNDVNMIPFREL